MLTSYGWLWKPMAAGVVLLSVLSGCATVKEPEATGESLTVPDNVVAVPDLARRLGFGVLQSDAALSHLVGGNNVLMIFADPVSEVNLNGRVIARGSGIVFCGGQMYVPVSVAAQIQQAVNPNARVFSGGQAVSGANPVNRGAVRGRVVIDPGHGGKDPGAHDAMGRVEKSLTLAVANLAAEKLKQRGVTVMLTRSRDVFIELDDRAKYANGFRADLFISIHADSNRSAEKFGHSILLPQSGNPMALYAAQWLNRQLVMYGSPCHGLRTDDRGLVVLKRTTCPAILLEMGFLSNPTDAARLSDPTFQNRLAEGIADGVAEYLRHKR